LPWQISVFLDFFLTVGMKLYLLGRQLNCRPNAEIEGWQYNCHPNVPIFSSPAA